MPSKVSRFLNKQPPGRILAMSSTFLFLVAYFDWTTGTDVRLGVLYLVPVVLVTLFVGKRMGLVMGAVAALAWLYVDMGEGKGYTRPHIAYINAVIRFIFFTLSVYVLSSWKQIGLKLEQAVRERTAAISAEVAERKAAEESLHKLAMKLSDVEDAERRRLAHDIHDTVGQNLSVVKFRLESAASQAVDGARSALVDSAGLIDSLIQQTRNLTFELHPPMLEDLGLTAALRWYAKVFNQQTQTQVNVEEFGEPMKKLPVSIGSNLFRSVKELMNNARKHGKATEIVISVYWRPNDVRVVVDDNGQGFEPTVALANPARGLGLAGIQERTSTMGGTMELESEKEKGSRAILRLPLTF